MAEVIVNSELALQRAIGDLREDWKAHKFLRLRWTAGSKRSLSQNDIAHAWYEQVAREMRDDDADGVKAFCKLHFGVPILRSEDADFRAMYDDAIKGLTYEQKLKVMRLLPVTSLMTKRQSSRYLEELRDHYRTRGVFLEFPEAAA